MFHHQWIWQPIYCWATETIFLLPLACSNGKYLDISPALSIEQR